MMKINHIENINNLRKKFFRDGYVKIERLFNTKYLKMLKRNTTNLRNKYKTQEIQIHKNNRRVEELFKNNVLKNQISFILNFKSIYGLQSERFFNPPKTNGFPPHQDDFFIRSGRYNSANLWIPFQNVRKKNGSLFFFTKSNKERINSKLNLKSLNDKNFKLYKFKRYKKKSINCNIGDAILISNRVIHGSGGNKSNSRREVLVLGYIKKGSKFNSGKTARRKPFKI